MMHTRSRWAPLRRACGAERAVFLASKDRLPEKTPFDLPNCLMFASSGNRRTSKYDILYMDHACGMPEQVYGGEVNRVATIKIPITLG